MISTHKAIRKHLLSGISFQETNELPSLRRTEWSQRFERFMRNRLLLGAYRYGLINDKDKSGHDFCGDIIRRIAEYVNTGNMECLVDVANMAMLEFEEGNVQGRHFSSSDDGEHIKEI